jgi:hypothetical protein
MPTPLSRGGLNYLDMKDVIFNFYIRLDKYIDDPLYYEFTELGSSSLRIEYGIKILRDLCILDDCTRQLTTLQL